MGISILSLFGIIWAFMTTLILVRYYTNKHRTSIDTYISKKRMNNISFKKALKFWVILQVISLIFVSDPIDGWMITFGLPITIIYVLFTIYYFDTFPKNEEEYDREVDEKDYERYVKSENRDRKLKKILK